MKIRIDFLPMCEKDPLELEAETIGGAVEMACKDLSYADLSGANLSCANLSCANLSGANLSGAQRNGRTLYGSCPILQFGPCGRQGRSTVVFFHEDGGAPDISCGCFRGTVQEFEAQIHETHAGTFHEIEYMAIVDHIRTIWRHQNERKRQ